MIESVIGNLPAFTAVLNKIKDVELPANICFQVIKNANIINTQLENMNEAELKIIKQYAELNNGELQYSEDGRVKIQDGKYQECAKQLDILYKTKINLDISKIPVSALSQVSITPMQMMAVQEMIDDGN